MGKWTKENFEIFHQKNPQIYERFCHYALKALEKRKKYSAKAIMHRVRWEAQIDYDKGDFKIDDGWISHYARKFMEDHPEHRGVFELRNRANSYHAPQVGASDALGRFV